MPQQEKRFTTRRVDAQFEQIAQAALSSSNTPNERVVASLRTLYREQIDQEQQSLQRMRQRLEVAVTSRQQEQRHRTGENIAALNEAVNVSKRRNQVRLSRPRRPWLGILEQGAAVFLVLAIVASWFAISHLPRSSRNSPLSFSDANARPIGAPTVTIQGNFTTIYEWTPDSRTFVALQVDTQKQELEARIMDIASGHSTIYPVLDSSWIQAVNLENPFQILMGRYLLAVRADGKNLATLEIWDIIGRRAITMQTVPAQTLGTGNQLLSPWIVSSNDEQKFAMFSPDGTVTIWDVASGRKLLTCEGKVSYKMLTIPPIIKWYNHDQSLLFLDRLSGQLEAWNVSTGKRFINLSETTKTFIEPGISPDSNYLAVTLGHPQTIGNVRSYHTDVLEILDARSGKVLHNYPLSNPNVTFAWLPDSQRLLVISAANGSSSSIRIWNVFNNHITFVTTFSQADFTWTTPDSRYLILGPSDAHSIAIFRTNDGRQIATVTTPGIYARTDSYFATNNQYMLIGLKGDFDIWDIATGKLLYKFHGSTPFSIERVDGGNVFWSPGGKYLTMLAGRSPSTIGEGILSFWRMP